MARRCFGWMTAFLAVMTWTTGLMVPAFGAQQAPLGAPSLDPQIRSLLLEKSLPLLDDGSKQLQRARLDGVKAPSGLNAVLVMCDFSDSLMLGRYGSVVGDFPPPTQRERIYAAHDSLYFDHQLQYVADYYSTVSAGRFDFEWTIHPRVVNLPNPMGYYGQRQAEIGERKIELAAAVIDSLEDEIDFFAYDTILLVHAGAGEETDILGNSPEQIYSSYLSPEDFAEAVELGVLAQPYIPCRGYPEGEGIDRVLVLPETEYQDPYGDWDGHFGSLGVYCFEIGLRLGMLSLSDATPSGNPDSQGIGQYGLMGYGLYTGIGLIPPHPCAFNKTLMGWVDVVDLDPMTYGRHILEPAAGPVDPGTVYRVSLTGQEYWLIEYRLQDGDGNRAFSFADDKNHNFVYDYWDASTESHRPQLWGDFDAAADSLERPLGAEWDFSMSENGARAFGELGFGSGAYVWHVDEGRIRDVFDSPTNLFNADPDHKSVDLEEADGIQDLDSAIPSSYWLGGDNDSFRGEGADSFGPDTRPATVTAAGSRTGIAFTEFSRVFQKLRSDTLGFNLYVDPPVPVYGIQYADTLAFTLSYESSLEALPELAVRREFPAGTDLRGSHVLIADLDAMGTDDCGNEGPAEIVLASRGGDVFVLDETLDETPDQDGDASRISPIAIGTRGGDPVTWNLPPAVGDLDGDGAPEIVLTSADGLYAFEADGSPVYEAEAGSFGLYADLGDCELPPVLLPLAEWDGFCLTEAVAACVVVREGNQSSIRMYFGDDGAQMISRSLGIGRIPSPPVFCEGYLLAALADSASGTADLIVWFQGVATPETQTFWRIALQIEPGDFPVSVVRADETGFAVHVPGRDGRTETLLFADGFASAPQSFVWRDEVAPQSPLGPGQSFLGDGVLARAGSYGHWLDGWPRRPEPALEAGADSVAASPLVVGLLDSDLPLWQYLFAARDGRIFATGTLGEDVPFWPLAGPAQSAGTPAVGCVGETGALDLVAIGTFARITGWDDASDSLEGEEISSIFLWKDLFRSDALWPMWGGSPWRNGEYDLDAFSSPPYAAGGSGLVPGSHECYPSPLLSGPLHVRGALRSEGRVRAYVYNLEGEEVARTDWVTVGSPDPFTIEVPVDGAVTGVYLSRIEVESNDGSQESSVRQFAIVH